MTLAPADSRFALFAGLVLVVLVLARVALLVRDLDVERRRAEESERKFRMVFERSPLGISIGRNGRMSQTNPALQEMLGYSGDEFANMHYTQVTHPDALDLPEQDELDAGIRDNFAVDKRYVAKDGHAIAAHVHVVLDGDEASDQPRRGCDRADRALAQLRRRRRWMRSASLPRDRARLPQQPDDRRARLQRSAGAAHGVVDPEREDRGHPRRALRAAT
jgi:PAS domain S-box-containing protein